MLLSTFLPSWFLNLHFYRRAYWSWGPDLLKFSAAQKQREKHFYYNIKASVYHNSTTLYGGKHDNSPLIAISIAFKS